MKSESLKHFEGGLKEPRKHINEVVDAVTEHGIAIEAIKSAQPKFRIVLTGVFNGVAGYCVVAGYQAPLELPEE